MKLWLISQNVNDDYDTFDSAVVAAKSEDEARLTHPSKDAQWIPERDVWLSGSGIWARTEDNWANPAAVSVKELGEATPGTEPGVILASFNAG